MNRLVVHALAVAAALAASTALAAPADGTPTAAPAATPAAAAATPADQGIAETPPSPGGLAPPATPAQQAPPAAPPADAAPSGPPAAGPETPSGAAPSSVATPSPGAPPSAAAPASVAPHEFTALDVTPPAGGSAAAGAPPASASDLAAQLTACRDEVTALDRRAAAAEPKHAGLIPHVLFGPKLAILNLPTPTIGLETRFYDVVGLSFDYGYIPKINAGSMKVGFTNWNVAARVFPWQGAFFVGAAYGHYQLEGTSTATATGGATVATQATMESAYVAPELGWRFIGSSGFFTGIDLGWAFNTGYTSTLSAPAGANLGNLGDLKTNADKVLKSGIPLVGLLEIGWLL